MASSLKNNKKLIIIVFVALIIFLGIWFLIRQLNSPAEGDIAPVTKSSNTNETIKYQNLGSKYINLDIQDVYEKKPADNNQTFLEQLLYSQLIRQLAGSKNISTSVRNLSSSLNNESAYALRKNKPTIYKESNKTINGNKFVIFESSADGNYEYIAFNQKTSSSMLSTIALSSRVVSQSDLKPEFDALLKSFSWK